MKRKETYVSPEMAFQESMIDCSILQSSGDAWAAESLARENGEW